MLRHHSSEVGLTLKPKLQPFLQPIYSDKLVLAAIWVRLNACGPAQQLAHLQTMGRMSAHTVLPHMVLHCIARRDTTIKQGVKGRVTGLCLAESASKLAQLSLDSSSLHSTETKLCVFLSALRLALCCSVMIQSNCLTVFPDSL